MDTVHGSEEWRPVEGFPYEVSSLGRVRRTGAGSSTWAGRVLKPRVITGGYHQVTLYRDGWQAWQVKVATLVCTAFHGAKPSAGLVVRHLNGAKTDDNRLNL